MCDLSTRSSRFYPSLRIYLRSSQSSCLFSFLRNPVHISRTRENAREYEQNFVRRISMSDFRAKNPIRLSLLPWRGCNLPTLESFGEYFYNSVIRDFLACLRTWTKLTEGENSQDVRSIKKRPHEKRNRLGLQYCEERRYSNDGNSGITCLWNTCSMTQILNINRFRSYLFIW